jgi:hypothetical protein
MINRRGDIGDILSFFPVFFALFFLMGIFLILCAFAGDAFGESESVQIGSLTRESLLLKKMDYGNESELVLDFVLRKISDKDLSKLRWIEDEDKNALDKIAKEVDCTYLKIYPTQFPDIPAFEYWNSPVNQIPAELYIQKGLMKIEKREISFGSDKFAIESYFGGCE